MDYVTPPTPLPGNRKGNPDARRAAPGRQDLKTYFYTERGVVRAVDGVTFV